MDHLLYDEIRSDIVALLQAARAASARSVNALMTATYWEVGRRIVEFEQLGRERAEYGEGIIKQLAADLEPRFGRGFGWRKPHQMRAFSLAWPASRILQTVFAEIRRPSCLTKWPNSSCCPGRPTSACSRSSGPKPARFTRQRLCVPAGRFASSTARSAASFTSGSRSPITRPRCLRRLGDRRIRRCRHSRGSHQRSVRAGIPWPQG